MVLSLISILWLVFIVMGVSIMFFRFHHNNQLLGVTLSKTHASDEEVKDVIKAFTKTSILVTGLSMALSLCLFLPALKRYGEVFLLLLVFGNIIGHFYVFNHYQTKLIGIKTKNDWVYARKKIMAVDLDVARQKGKASISQFWVWLLFGLSFIPLVYLLVKPEVQTIFPLSVALIGPFCQIMGAFFYYQMRNQRLAIPADNTEVNLVYAQQVERVNSVYATLMAFILLAFWLLLSFSMIYSHSSLVIVLPLALLTLGLLGVSIWHQRKLRLLEATFSGSPAKQDEPIYEQEGTWKWGLYHNPSDPRLFVPKRVAGFGWTINTAHRSGKFFAWGTVILIIALVAFVFYSGITDYEFTLTETELIIDAAMYDRTYTKDQIISLETITTMPPGRRTSGYGGTNKSYGHFAIDGYGKCMLYVYNNVDQYIVLELDGDNPAYVIINHQTKAETKELYQDLVAWLGL